VGLVAAGKVVGGQGCEERYWDVQLFEPALTQFSPVTRAMPFQRVTESTGKKFFWARILKVPYLSPDEAAGLAAGSRSCC
jgi:hypothetical protein